jgi:hypothetical protein
MATLPTQVRPGDVISSDLFNRLLAELADLDRRISDLEAAANAPALVRIFSLTGPTPIRVGSRVTANGENFSRPAGANTILVDGTRVTSIAEGTSDGSHLSFDIPDPGLGGTGRDAVLWVTNAVGRSGSFSFRLEPADTAPFGTITPTYDQPPVGSGTGPNLVPGPYEFGFLLTAAVDQAISVQLQASLGGVSGWTAELLKEDGTPITGAIPVAAMPGTLRFKVRVAVPSTGASTAILQVSAQEMTAGTHVPPSSAPTLSLTRGSAIPQPETRVAARLENSSGVSTSGGQVTFTSGTRGRLDFGFAFNLGTGVTGSTTISWAFSLETATSTGWNIESPSTSGTTLIGATGTGASSIGLTPGTTAGATRLALRITATPAGQHPVDITYLVPLRIS